MSEHFPSSEAPDTPRSSESRSTTPDDAVHPTSPHTPSFDSPLLSPNSRDHAFPRAQAQARSISAAFTSSPLNPNSPIGTRSRPVSRGSTYFNRIASEDVQALSQYGSFGAGTRGSMVLYRLASDDTGTEALLPPKTPLYNRDSVVSSSGDSVFSLSSDSRFPTGPPAQRGFVPYAYDPDMEKDVPDDDDDDLHKPEYGRGKRSYCSLRGILNVTVIIILILALLTLFICYPMLDFFQNEARNLAITANTAINGTGQSATDVPSFKIPKPIDDDTPEDAKSRTGFDGEQYELVFSDEFNLDGRTFFPGDDPYWEAVDIWYGATADQEWYDPRQVITKNGALQITMEQVTDTSLNHNLPYRSGMLQSWNKFCFTSGYIEVAMTLPGPTSSTRATATTDGTWPYSYDSCDVGTFPNQTFADGSGPAAALNSAASRTKYNNELSWLPGQRLSSCTCPGEDHPGPSNSKGRGVPEIDIIEAEANKTSLIGQVASQSAQFAPFSHDYTYINDTQDAWWVYDESVTRPNDYKGSAIQQAVSGLSNLPDDMFQGSGANFRTLGFEYWANPSQRDEGFITWQVDGKATVRVGASAMAADSITQVGQRIIPEEPMSIVLNLGISSNWQTIDLTTMEFPAIMQIDYVRVYQRSGSTNVGCDPPDYPTKDYIEKHPEAYSNADLLSWAQPSPAGAGYAWPKNSAYAGSC
ncbi:beta-glucan synthesis-associated [Epithele typhae]|uniref:beta-glucan synthesis-associated n=1 Tax=Epithele typhae TaxID=378194 RepID=UPI0020072026|nr:beta-glucan synthesis-associated [Epithele typhae]KAH9919444.1 beta-glucan synthesis-associated [Epithele typhae]